MFSSWCINGCDTLCPPWLLCGHDSAYNNVREYFGLFKLQVGVDVVDADRPCLANGSMPVCRPCLRWLPAAACVRDRPMTTTAHICCCTGTLACKDTTRCANHFCQQSNAVQHADCVFMMHVMLY